MSSSIQLEQMTTAEKLETMELLWDNLCHKLNDVPSPHWHKTLLQEREERVATGKETFFDLDDAKKRIEALIK